MTPTSHIEIYESDDGQTQIDVRLEHETLWLSRAQMAELFEKHVRTINEQLQTIFKEGELDKGGNYPDLSDSSIGGYFRGLFNHRGILGSSTLWQVARPK